MRKLAILAGLAAAVLTMSLLAAPVSAGDYECTGEISGHVDGKVTVAEGETCTVTATGSVNGNIEVKGTLILRGSLNGNIETSGTAVVRLDGATVKGGIIHDSSGDVLLEGDPVWVFGNIELKGSGDLIANGEHTITGNVKCVGSGSDADVHDDVTVLGHVEDCPRP